MVFDDFDEDKSGSIDAREFRLAAGRLGRVMSKSEAKDVIKMLDLDHNGTVSFDEFSQWLKSNEPDMKGGKKKLLMLAEIKSRIAIRKARGWLKNKEKKTEPQGTQLRIMLKKFAKPKMKFNLEFGDTHVLSAEEIKQTMAEDQDPDDVEAIVSFDLHMTGASGQKKCIKQLVKTIRQSAIFDDQSFRIAHSFPDSKTCRLSLSKAKPDYPRSFSSPVPDLNDLAKFKEMLGDVKIAVQMGYDLKSIAERWKAQSLCPSDLMKVGISVSNLSIPEPLVEMGSTLSLSSILGAVLGGNLPTEVVELEQKIKDFMELLKQGQTEVTLDIGLYQALVEVQKVIASLGEMGGAVPDMPDLEEPFHDNEEFNDFWEDVSMEKAEPTLVIRMMFLLMGRDFLSLKAVHVRSPDNGIGLSLQVSGVKFPHILKLLDAMFPPEDASSSSASSDSSSNDDSKQQDEAQQEQGKALQEEEEAA